VSVLLAATELARGDESAAEGHLRDALAGLDTTGEPTRDRQAAADLLTPLEWVTGVEPGQADAPAEIRGEAARLESSLVVGRELPGEAPPASPSTSTS